MKSEKSISVRMVKELLREADNRETSEKRLHELANSSEYIVASQVLMNPNAPDSVYEQVIEGENPTIRCVKVPFGDAPIDTVEEMRGICGFDNSGFCRAQFHGWPDPALSCTA